MENNNSELIIQELVNAFKEYELEEVKYDFFNANEFQKRFKSLLAFTCILGSINENFSNITLKEVDHSYVFEKYCLYIKEGCEEITEEEKEMVLIFSGTVKKLHKPDTLIHKWEEVFGKNSFFKISINNNYRKGLHAIIKRDIFDVYMKNLFNKSKKYKIWKILNNK